MQNSAKYELAKAIIDTINAREGSYRPGKYLGDLGCYTLTWQEAARQAIPDDPDTRDLVAAMCMSGYCDFPEWAERVLQRLPQPA